jgi:hypothetical protein
MRVCVSGSIVEMPMKYGFLGFLKKPDKLSLLFVKRRRGLFASVRSATTAGALGRAYTLR